MGKIILFLLVLSISAYGEELRRFPGWKISKIEKAQSADGSYKMGPDYYGLTPPDSRPAVTIEARVARQLKAGQVRPEDVYGQAGGKKQDKAAKAEDVYKPGGGYVHADEIGSTLPGYDPKGDQSGISGRASREGNGPAGSVSGYGGTGSGGAADGNPYGTSYTGYASGSPSDSGVITTGPSAGYSGGPGTSSGDGVIGSAASASASAGANGGSYGDNGGHAATTTAAATGGKGNAVSGTNPFGSGLAVANGGLVGYGFKSGSKDGARSGSSGGGEGDGVGGGSLADRPLVRTNVPPPCQRGRYVYSEPTYLRLKLPRGCNLIHISAWGAGGGSGSQTRQMGQGAPTTVEVPGGGGSFMSTSWQIDADKYDLVVVVGATGKKVVRTVTQEQAPGGGDSGTTTKVTYSGGAAGFPGAKNGSGTGGGGGGYSGVFLVSKTSASKEMKPDWAMAIGNGGAGGAGGGAGGSVDVKGTAPSATMTNKIGENARGRKPGFQYYPERGSAGNPGTSGKVIIEYF